MRYLKCWAEILLCCAVALSTAAEPLFEKPRTFRQHKMLLLNMMQAIQLGDIEKMEAICRKAVEVMPDDATWRYNLACALAHRADKSKALDTLERAIELGFRNAEAIEQDSDLKQLKGEIRFDELLQKARNMHDKPVPGVPELKPPTIVMGLPVEINPSNTVWNMDAGCFQSHFNLMQPSQADARSNTYNGPVMGKIRDWLKKGEASGNGGDLYMNRDRGHSMLQTTDFPLMTPVRYCQDAVDADVDHNLPNTIFDYPLIGNCSMAMTQGVFWRSLPRAAMVDQFAAITQCRLYLLNQMWVYPEHNDYDAEKGDLFPVNAPFFTVAQGSSFADQPLVRAFVAAMAALPPETKKMLIRKRILAPNLQMLLRYSSLRNREPSQYLSGAAHPVVFSAEDINVTNLVEMAHALRVEDTLPPVALQVVREDQAVAGVDYFDQLPETLFNTPVCIARMFRSRAYKRRMRIEAQAPIAGEATYKWVLLQGNPSKVQIKELDAQGSRVELTIAWHGWYRPLDADGTPARLMSSRVDIGCFLKGEKYCSAPSIVSVYCDPAEQRLYNEGRVVSIDYNNPDKHYSDPALAVLKPWKDLFVYNDAGKLRGWYRKLGDRNDRFTFAGHRVLTTDAQERPVRACAVDYLPRHSGSAGTLPLMTYTDSSEVFIYHYSSDKDLIGKFTPER